MEITPLPAHGNTIEKLVKTESIAMTSSIAAT
jgi:hypothetical protein